MANLLELRNVSKSFGGLHVSRDVTFSLASGDRVALIGPNGAGKTTLVNLVSGAEPLTSGRILLNGQDISKLSIAARVNRGLVRTFQVTRLFASLTVAQNVALAILQRERMTRACFSAVAQASSIHAECRERLDTLGLAGLAGLPAARLAYGQQRLLELAIGLALNPEVLLLDEPAAGVPHDEVPRILEAIERLPPGIAVLMIEHDMDLVFRFARRVLVLADGLLIFQGTPAAAANDSDVRRAYLGSYAHARRTA